MLDLLGEWFISLPIVCVSLIIISFFFPPFWIFVLSVMLGYLLTDIILSTIFIRGGEGWAIVPILGDLFQKKGTAYIAYFIGIVVSTYLISNVLNMIIAIIENADILLRFGLSLLVALAVFYDFNVRHYDTD